MIARVVPLMTALIAIIYWATARKRDLAPPPPRPLELLLFGLPLYFGLQLIPLPPGLLGVLSPMRLELQQAIARIHGGPVGLTPLSAAPCSTLSSLLLLASCVLIALLVRELVWRCERRTWIAVAPLIALGIFEAALGLAQPEARGTYVNRDHFAALLAFLLPFPLAWGLSTLSKRRDLPLRTVLHACTAFAASALMLTAVIRSSSRTGFLAALLGIAVIAIRAVGRARFALPFAIAFLAAAFFLLPTDTLIGRFASLQGADASAATRLQLWRETVPLIRDYPTFGCGLGTYESVMTRYKSVAPLYTVDFAHNDYIQLAAEAGVTGLLLALAAAVFITGSAWREAGHGLRHAAPLASLAAIALTACFDFGLHMPLSALAAAWVCGLACFPRAL